MTKKFSLSFVNKGKPFVMPKWTVGKHRAAMNKMLKDCKNLSEDEKNEEFNYYVIHETLAQIDGNVTIDDIRNMHPEDVVILFNEVYNAGKEGVYFREGKKPVKKQTVKKSTGTKK